MANADQCRSNNALRERITQLEAQLAAVDAASPLLFQHDGVDHLFSPPDSAREMEKPQQSDIADVVGFLSLGAEPTYVGASSGISLAASLSEMVQATVWSKVLSTAVEKPSATMNMAELKRNAAGPPDDDIGARILDAYLIRYVVATHGTMPNSSPNFLQSSATVPIPQPQRHLSDP